MKRFNEKAPKNRSNKSEFSLTIWAIAVNQKRENENTEKE